MDFFTTLDLSILTPATTESILNSSEELPILPPPRDITELEELEGLLIDSAHRDGSIFSGSFCVVT
jgi:hypothetical protein